MKNTISIEEKYRLIDTPVTLDGKPARVCGALMDFPIVGTLDGKQSIEFSWNAVQHIISNCDGKFRS